VGAAVEFLRTVLNATGDSVVMVSQAGEREVFPAFLYGNLVQIANR
jgi:hypothetical protein